MTKSTNQPRGFVLLGGRSAPCPGRSAPVAATSTERRAIVGGIAEGRRFDAKLNGLNIGAESVDKIVVALAGVCVQPLMWLTYSPTLCESRQVGPLRRLRMLAPH